MKTVLITGAAKGIGKAMAIAFAENGYAVGINYNTSEKLANELKSALISLGTDAEIFKADVSNSNEALNLAENFIKRFGHIDVLINNAGISKISPITDVTVDDWNKIILTNLNSAFYVTKPLLPYFINSKAGTIINIASIWGKIGASCEVAYSTSKAGLIGFTKALSKELGPSGIRVNAIAPGFIDTDMAKDLSESDKNDFTSQLSLERIGTSKDIAGIALFLASENAGYITGQCITADGGI